MSEIHQTITIDALVEKVLDLLVNPENIPTFAPNVERVEDIVRSGRIVGDTFRVIYKALGMTFDHRLSVTTFGSPPKTTPHRRYQIRWFFDGQMKGSLTWTLEAQDNQTDVSVDVEYELAGGVLGKAVDVLLLERTNNRNVKHMLQNMKRVLAPQVTSAR